MLSSIFKFVSLHAKLIAITIVLLACAIFYWGPNVIHQMYRSGVSETEKIERKLEYNNLANKEQNKFITELELANTRKERMNIYLWFHTRGWNIDEGWHENFIQKKTRDWSELIEYWQT